MENKVYYTYDIYYNGEIVHDHEDTDNPPVFGTELEAKIDARIMITDIMEFWYTNGFWHVDDDEDYFEVKIIELELNEYDEWERR